LQFCDSLNPPILIFLGESWIFQNGSQARQWLHDSDLKGNPSRIRAEGKRFTVLHAGCASGFLEGCTFLLDNKIEHRDYHKNMSGELFKKWINDQVVVIMDNALYHTIHGKGKWKSGSRDRISISIQHQLKKNYGCRLNLS
jgi:hypothetical protein